VGNDHLEKLFIIYMAIHDEVLVLIGNALKKYIKLKELACPPKLGNDVGETGRRALIAGLKGHRMLRLSLYDENITPSQKYEIHFYSERNANLWPLLNADPQLPLSLWPEVFQRICMFHGIRNPPLDMLHFLVKEKSDLCRRVRDNDAHQSKTSA